VGAILVSSITRSSRCVLDGSCRSKA